MEALLRVRDLPNLENADLRWQNFSDSLILSTANTAEGFWSLIYVLDALSQNLLRIGVLARGAVTRDGIYHDDEIVFGKGVVEAYRLESTVARFPRVILGRVACEDAKKYGQSEPWEGFHKRRLVRDSDGVVFIHFLGEMFAALQKPDPDRQAYEVWSSEAQRMWAMIQPKIDATFGLTERQPGGRPHVERRPLRLVALARPPGPFRFHYMSW